MSDFDKEACYTVFNLSREFGIIPTYRSNHMCEYSIGIEIEIKFRNAFPKIFEQYVIPKNYHPIDNLIKNKEDLYLKTIECGIPRGQDKYWEFSFNPVHNASLLVDQVEILTKAGLIPDGDHSLHITIGGIDKNENSYWILRILELLFLPYKERMLELNFNKKGLGGILERLYCGYEMRTLMMNKNTDMSRLFYVLDILLKGDSRIEIVKQEILKTGLPDEIWMPRTMEKYIDHFDELKIFVSKLF